MPKQKKIEEEDFDDMLAEFQAADLAAASDASSSSSTAETDARPSMTSLPRQTAERAAGPQVLEVAIIDACSAANLDQLRRWGRQSVRVETAEPLCLSVYGGASFNIISCLVKELGADVNQQDESGSTALTAATFRDNHELVRNLVEELGADPNNPNQLGYASLYLAASQGYLAVVRILLQLGAGINRRCKLGATPLMVASILKHQEVIKWLVKAGADTLICSNNISAADISRRADASSEQVHAVQAGAIVWGGVPAGALEGAQRQLQEVERRAGGHKG
jgi:hypothetical protein